MTGEMRRQLTIYCNKQSSCEGCPLYSGKCDFFNLNDDEVIECYCKMAEYENMVCNCGNCAGLGTDICEKCDRDKEFPSMYSPKDTEGCDLS